MTTALPEIAGANHGYISARGIEFHYVEAGEGQPVLLLHGWPQNFYCYHELLADPPEGLRLIAVDLPGYGWSGPASHRWAKEDVATDVLAFMDELDLNDVILVGHDWGGWIGFLMALREPERFKAFLALNIAHPYNGLKQWRYMAPLLAYQPLVASVGKPLHRFTPFVKYLIIGALSNRESVREQDVEVYSESFKDPQAAATARDTYRTFLTREVPYGLRNPESRRLTVKTRMLFGNEDMAIHTALVEKPPLAEDYEVELVDGCGHFILDERPDAVRERLLRLVEELQQA